MRWKGITKPVLLLLAVLMPILGWAQEKPSVVLKLSAQKEVAVQDGMGKVRSEWREVESSAPGDLLKYTITYRNEGKVEARNVTIVDPIPPGTVYVANGAEGAGAVITFSVDGKNFQAQPVLKYKAGNEGREQEYFAAPEMYSHVRWILTKAVPPGGTGEVSFKVRVR